MKSASPDFECIKNEILRTLPEALLQCKLEAASNSHDARVNCLTLFNQIKTKEPSEVHVKATADRIFKSMDETVSVGF
jgi:hypothetical protein